VERVWGEGYWYQAGEELVPIRWVFVHDLSGTHRDEYFYTTDTTLPPERIVGWFTERWSIEVTFQEVRQHLGFTTPRNWCPKSVLRTAPCLLGVFSLVALIFHRLWQRHPVAPRRDPWYAKKEVTFSDALAAVRRFSRDE
jgi:hypothetical protein